MVLALLLSASAALHPWSAEGGGKPGTSRNWPAGVMRCGEHVGVKTERGTRECSCVLLLKVSCVGAYLRLSEIQQWVVQKEEVIPS